MSDNDFSLQAIAFDARALTWIEAVINEMKTPCRGRGCSNTATVWREHGGIVCSAYCSRECWEKNKETGNDN